MSVEVTVDDKSQNGICLRWDRWPTNVLVLWMPETWGSTGEDRFVVKEAVGWKSEGDGVCVGPLETSYGDRSFQWRARLTPAEEAVEIKVVVENTGGSELPPLFYINGCLNFVYAPDFMDSTGGYTFFRSAAGWQDMKPLRRPQALRRGHDPHHISIEGRDRPPDTKETGDVRAVSSLCVRAGRTGEACVGFAWERSSRLHVNFNRLHCIHSVPVLGPIAPGGFSTRKGKIYFHEGGKDDLVELCKEDGFE